MAANFGQRNKKVICTPRIYFLNYQCSKMGEITKVVLMFNLLVQIERKVLVQRKFQITHDGGWCNDTAYI